MVSKAKIRCAIYTRTSSDERLSQNFNSLAAQREACQAYITSQRHEGWSLVSKNYDDGGLSGGTMDRPALQRLMIDIKSRRIDRIVVYKVDRLTRALSDFARLVDELEANDCSFVSVTQAFNTSTSMGRLTLNVLLSFAQFERELTAERIRDKIAASKARGLWMGGKVPMGYEAKGRTLKVNGNEAVQVKRIFMLYLESGCIRKLAHALKSSGIRSRLHTLKDGRAAGGNVLMRSQLQYMLRNPIYIGKIRHKDKLHEGRHDAIISDDLWAEVQNALDDKAPIKSLSSRTKSGNLLAGKVFDAENNPLSTNHSKKSGRRYRYYISKILLSDRAQTVQGKTWRLPAFQLELAIANAISNHIARMPTESFILDNFTAETIQRIIDKQSLLQRNKNTSVSLMIGLVDRVSISENSTTITMLADKISDLFGVSKDIINPETLTICQTLALKRRGVETKLIIGEAINGPDAVLQRTLREALEWRSAIKNGLGVTILANQLGVNARHVRSRIQLAFLSPKIMQAIATGTQPSHLSTEILVRTEIPLCWRKQEILFGFSSGGN